MVDVIALRLIILHLLNLFAHNVTLKTFSSFFRIFVFYLFHLSPLKAKNLEVFVELLFLMRHVLL